MPAVTVFLFGVVVKLGVGLIVSGYIKEGNVEDVSNIFTVIGSATTTLLLVIAGYVKSNRMRGRVLLTQQSNN